MYMSISLRRVPVEVGAEDILTKHHDPCLLFCFPNFHNSFHTCMPISQTLDSISNDKLQIRSQTNYYCEQLSNDYSFSLCITIC